jgi:hypothetical protein
MLMDMNAVTKKINAPVGGEERQECQLRSMKTYISLLLPKNLQPKHLFQILEMREQ